MMLTVPRALLSPMSGYVRPSEGFNSCCRHRVNSAQQRVECSGHFMECDLGYIRTSTVANSEASTRISFGNAAKKTPTRENTYKSDIVEFCGKCRDQGSFFNQRGLNKGPISYSDRPNSRSN